MNKTTAILVAAIIGFGAYWIMSEERDRKRNYVAVKLGNGFDVNQLSSNEVKTLYEVFRNYDKPSDAPDQLKSDYQAIATKYNILI